MTSPDRRSQKTRIVAIIRHFRPRKARLVATIRDYASGAALTLGAAVVLVDAFARFVVEGMGTPAPVAPTRQLVVGGLYRYVGNPMYIAVTTAIVGQALLFGQPGLLWYAGIVGAAMFAFARWVEEPMLLEQFGAEYGEYRRSVPGWWPRLRPWTRPS